MELKIRAAHLSDLPYMYEICLKTALSGKDATDYVSDKYIIGQYFLAPYLHFEIDLCFVATNDVMPLGYIVGASVTSDFNSWMNREWLPVIRKKYSKTMPVKSEFETFILNLINRDCFVYEFLNKYPSHLHINLLPQLQGRGIARKLMSVFVDSLTSKGVSGLYLSVGKKNTNAIKFYEKTGFSYFAKKPGALFMGMTLQKKV